jgi:hypothetical protein
VLIRLASDLRQAILDQRAVAFAEEFRAGYRKHRDED